MPIQPSDPEHLLHNYFLAKDGNRPHLMAYTFADSARLEMRVKTRAVAFAPESLGLGEITDQLVRRFGQRFENVYSFYLGKPSPDAETFSCDWLVGMSEKASGDVYVGCGRYDWTFGNHPLLRVTHLVIAIERMHVLPAEHLQTVMAWVSALPYPWCSAGDVLSSAPKIPQLAPVLQYLTPD